MRKLFLGIIMGLVLLVNDNPAMASDYWVYSSDRINYYVVEESLRAVKGAYEMEVKEVLTGGKVYNYVYGVYESEVNQISYYRKNSGRGIVGTFISNGHDLPMALWRYAVANDHGQLY